jgi:hypothetical protein
VSLLSQQPSPGSETRHSGELVPEHQPGSLFCVGCGWAFSIASVERLPQCPNCGSSDFRRASLFDTATIETGAVESLERPPEWLEEARAEVDQPGSYIAFSDGDEIAVIHLQAGWTRIGRSGAADLRLDDPTVSRRHALLVLTDDGDLRALDDRSLNGLFVNGNAVEWAALSDGDELEIGRYRLHVLRV